MALLVVLATPAGMRHQLPDQVSLIVIQAPMIIRVLCAFNKPALAVNGRGFRQYRMIGHLQDFKDSCCFGSC
jgi:hypothetical protein